MSKKHAALTATLALLLTPALASADTIHAASCSRADIVTAIGTSNDGDTVVVPAGHCVWDSGLSLSKGIHLQGVSADLVTIEMRAPWDIVKHPD